MSRLSMGLGDHHYLSPTVIHHPSPVGVRVVSRLCTSAQGRSPIEVKLLLGKHRTVLATDPAAAVLTNDISNSLRHRPKIISRYIDPEMSILHAGCGNSELCEHMIDDGYEKITNIDFSRVVIDQMIDKYGEGEKCTLGPDVIFHQMDFTDMQGEYEDKKFEAVIDKAAIDSLYCAELGAKKVKKALDEFDRVLTKEGVYISISYGRPEVRCQMMP